MAGQDSDHLVRNIGIGMGAITVALVALILVPELRRDRWEAFNAPRVSAALDEADRLQQSEPLAAYRAYEEVLKEVKQHKITDEQFAQHIANAERSRAALYLKVQDTLRAEEAEKLRLAKEEAKRAAAEKQRIADEEKQKLIEAESQRTAEEKRQAEEKRRREAVSLYRNAPQSARNAMNAIKKVEARTEIGINYRDYSTAVGEMWGDVKIFIESPDGKSLPEFSMLLGRAVKDYKLAVDIWQCKIQWPNLYGKGPHERDVDALQQACWTRAGMWIKLAESLLDVETTEKTLKAIVELGKEKDLDAVWKGIEDEILHGK